MERDGTERSRAERSRAEQGRAEQSRAALSPVLSCPVRFCYVLFYPTRAYSQEILGLLEHSLRTAGRLIAPSIPSDTTRQFGSAAPRVAKGLPVPAGGEGDTPQSGLQVEDTRLSVSAMLGSSTCLRLRALSIFPMGTCPLRMFGSHRSAPPLPSSPLQCVPTRRPPASYFTSRPMSLSVAPLFFG
eukprot:gene14155-biopygen8077